VTKKTSAHVAGQGTASQKNEKKRVVVAMSGGVDSSVAAALLVEEGYDVIGMMMRLWSEPNTEGSIAVNRCCTPDQMADARRVANHLDIPFYVVDVQDHFRNSIVQFFIDEHMAGRTPNPCIECNRKIRFKFLLEHALALNAHYLATGHYARVQLSENGYELLQAVDKDKDQSYVLYTLNQNQLAHVLFPVGEYNKSEVRGLARQYGLAVAGKHESQDLCFLADGDYRRFLKQHSEQPLSPGPIVTEDGQELGQHAGLPFYTIGQRRQLGISASHPLHVLRKDIHLNALVVGRREALGRKELMVRGLNWIGGRPPSTSSPLQVKIRYKAQPVMGIISDLEHDSAHVLFDVPVFGVTPGQGAVFYDNNICLGGGLIADQMPAEFDKRSIQQGENGSQ